MQRSFTETVGVLSKIGGAVIHTERARENRVLIDKIVGIHFADHPFKATRKLVEMLARQVCVVEIEIVIVCVNYSPGGVLPKTDILYKSVLDKPYVTGYFGVG